MTNDQSAQRVPVLLITGPVGVGKSAVASEVSERLDQISIPRALVDIELALVLSAPAGRPVSH